MNFEINKILEIFQKVIQELLDFKNVNDKLFYKKDFNIENIKYIILFKLNHKCLSSFPNVVIFKFKANSNLNDKICILLKYIKRILF